ncbi:penicillin-binding protein activator [Halomonas sp. GXIMD04776]|uniref:penicillin-binding protein activator n=1 Tax=Halomonas sp. GXIMD04776 TaxID=3415605 RepID=UPI003CAE161E
MHKSLRRLLSAGLVALLMVGCAAQQQMMEPAQVSKEPAELLRQAQGQSAREAALTRLEAADILARRGDKAQALQIAGDIDSIQLQNAARLRWALLLSYLGLDQEDGQSVLQATSILDYNLTIPDDDAQTLKYRRGLALGLTGQPADAAEQLIDLQRQQAPFDLNDDIWRQMTRLRGPSLDQLARSGDDIARGWVALIKVQRRNGGDVDRLFTRIEQWRQRFPEHPAARRLPDNLRALRELRGQDVRHIAVFLPESGPLANVAEAIRQGMQVRHMNALDQGEQTPRLSFYDTRDADMETLYARASMAGAQVVIGPLDKDTVSRLELGNNVPLPTLALNYGTAEENHAEDLFQFGLSAEDEARQVARRARLDGHRLAGMLIPNNPWGRRVGEAFRQTWQEQGGEIASAIDYDPEGMVANAVRPLLDVRGKRARRDLDMLFLLALPDYARQVPPTLKFFYAGDLPIYATSHLFEGRPQPQADHDLNGVSFIDIPWLIPDAAVGGTDALPFAESYQELRDNNEPALFKLNAMGVDAYELGRRLPLFKLLPSNELYGATGALSAGPDRRIRRDLPWARFVSGVPQPPLYNIPSLEPVDEAP